MTFYAENESEYSFKFDWEELYRSVASAVLDMENCPYETEVSLLVTDAKRIRQINLESRQIDASTDVLSFPNLEFERESDFEVVEEIYADCFNPDSGELILGEIIVCASKAVEQAEQFGHSIKREFAFLIAHSMLHLCGYDHLTKEEEEIMTQKQEAVLGQLGIRRDQE